LKRAVKEDLGKGYSWRGAQEDNRIYSPLALKNRETLVEYKSSLVVDVWSMDQPVLLTMVM
jgi:hypothetical protein